MKEKRSERRKNDDLRRMRFKNIASFCKNLAQFVVLRRVVTKYTEKYFIFILTFGEIRFSIIPHHKL